MQTCDRLRIDLAWWTCVAEPEDAYAAALIAALGPEGAREWAEGTTFRLPPPELLVPGRNWEETHARWRPRALEARPERELETLAALGGRLLVAGDPEWPSPLDDLGPATPFALWVLGTPPGSRSVSVVGARAATASGERSAFDLGAGLAEAGVPVVSGGAFGIDVAAHRGCRAGGARTLAIMAGGLSSPYPQANLGEFETILAEGGALVSEAPCSWRPAKWRFLSRNRLIAAWSGATIVVEASHRSGALATARRALELGRGVGAVPGPVTSSASAGCHELIRNSAVLIRDAADALELLDPYSRAGQGVLFGEPVERDEGADALGPGPRRVYEALPKRASTGLSRLVRAAGLAEREVLAALAELELRGLVVSDSRGWSRSRSA